MKYDVFLKDENDDVINLFQGESIPSNSTLSNRSTIKFPRTFEVKNIDGNEDFYSKLFQQVDRTLRIESDQINGVYKVSLNEDVIILKEVL